MERVRALPASLHPYAEPIDRIEKTLTRNQGFLLLPIEVKGPDMARALGAFLSRPDRPCIIVDPGDYPQAWEELPAALLEATAEREEEPTLVLLVPPSNVSEAVHHGLRLLNQRRDTIVKALNRPLLWCGSAEFLNMAWEEAPDFWSIRAIDIRLIARAGEADNAIAHEVAADVPAAAREEIGKLVELRLDALAQNDFIMATQAALRMVDALLRHQSVEAAARMIQEVVHDARTPKTTPIIFEIALRRADVDAQNRRPFAATAELGALLARTDLPANIRARAALRMGRLFEDGGDAERAEGFYKVALDIAHASKDQELLAHALVGVYGIAARTGRTTEAENPLRQAETIATRIGDNELAARALAALATISINAEDRNEGVRQIDAAMVLRAQDVDKPLPIVMQGPADIVILTALQDELEAVLAVTGHDAWQDARDLSGFRYYWRQIQRTRDSFVIVAAWVGEMGQRSAAVRGQQLLTEFAPSCLAMCGICAGDRDKVSLGDIIVAERLFAWDEGKRIAEPGKEIEHFHELRSFDLEANWRMDAAFLAREMDLEGLSQARPPSKEAQTLWILHTLHAHETEGKPSPMQHPNRVTACPDWSARWKELLEKGLVVRRGTTLALTDAGRDALSEDLVTHPDGLPREPPVRVHVGALATVSSVVEDSGIFKRMQRVVKSTLGLEMEGLALGELAARFDKRAILVKAVQDFADGTKDDGFRAFACRASAEFLLAFLEKHFEPAERLNQAQDKRIDFHNAEVEIEDPFLEKVERIVALRHPTAKITRHRADLPFSGVLEVETDRGGFSDTSLVAALNKPIYPDLVREFSLRIERPFRDLFPYMRSTIVHQGPEAPRDLRADAYRKGIQLETFRAYQGLFNLAPYLEWQTNRLSNSPIYPPAMYVDAPASYEVSGHLERTRVENALKYLWDLLDSPDQRRFALVLGEFGAGKTFLLRELARRMHVEKHPVWPVLVEMHLLEKRHDLAELLGAHFARADVPGYNFRAFQYLLHEGRIALLFDGFDELAERVTYDTVTAHFGTVLSAAQGGSAKVVLSSRRQHFLSDKQVKLALAEQAQRVSGFRLVMLEPFGEVQIRQYLRNVLLDEHAANERYALIDEVKDLLGLSHNPRMLGFIARIPEVKLREAKKRGTITAADLYDVLVKDWLDFEHQRSLRMTTQKGISRGALDKGVTALALSMWHAKAKEAGVDQIRDVLAEAMRTLDEPALDPHVIAHMFGSGSLLVRDTEGQFSFVHRSVMEWLVARVCAHSLEQDQEPAALDVDEISPLMADFFSAMTSRKKVVAWAHEKLMSREKGIAAKNATLILQRLGESLARVDFSGRDLRGKDFTGVDWRGADLRGTNLEEATLVDADLSGANLTGARLARANLTRAKLVDSQLGGADLRMVRLVRADLTNCTGLDTAQLFRTNLAGAILAEEVERKLENSFGVATKVEKAEPMVAPSGSRCLDVAYDPAGNLLAGGFADGTVRIFDAETGGVLQILEDHVGSVNTIAFSPDGNTIISGSSDATLRVWKTGSARAVRILKGHYTGIQDLAFSRDGKTVVAITGERAVLWDATSGHLMREFPRGFSPNGGCVAFSPDGKQIVLSYSVWDGNIKLVDSASGQTIKVFDGRDAASCVAFSPDGKTIAFGDGDSVRISSIASGRVLCILKGHTKRVTSVAFSPDGKTIATGSYDKSIRVWDVNSARTLQFLERHTSAITNVAFGPSGKMIASCSYDDTLVLSDLLTGSYMRLPDRHFHKMNRIAFDSRGKTIISRSLNGSVRVWDCSAGRLLRVENTGSTNISKHDLSRDGKISATVFPDGTVRLFDLTSNQCKVILFATDDGWVAYSPDGRYKYGGNLNGLFWHAVGLCRFEVGEIDEVLPGLRMKDDEPFF